MMPRHAKPALVLAILLLLGGCMANYQTVPMDRQASLTGQATTHETRSADAAPRDEVELWIIARADTGAADGVLNDSAALVRTDDGEAHALPLVAATVRAQVRGLTCDVALTQRFTNPHATPIDASYRFPLPADARVREFVMVIGERRIRGIFREPDEARRLYASARRQGYRASLMTIGADHVLTHRVANLEPGRPIDVDLTYRHTLDETDGGYRFALPRLAGVRGVDRAAFDVSVDLQPGADITELESLSHVVEREALDATCTRVTLVDAGPSAMDEPFVLTFRVAEGVRLARAADHDEPSPGAADDAAIAVDATQRVGR